MTPDSRTPLATARVLLVDDDSEFLEFIVVFLRATEPGWEVVTATSEARAKVLLEDSRTQRRPFDILLTDLVLHPDDTSNRDGLKLLEEARRLDPSVMTILYSGADGIVNRPEIRSEAYAAGACDVADRAALGTTISQELLVKARAALARCKLQTRVDFLSRYFDRRLFETIERNPGLLDPRQRTITICFWDIRNFTRLCDSLKAYPELIVGFLKEHCDAAAQIIFKHGGLLDKFIGDGVMALFGVLDQDDGQEEQAAIAAVGAARSLRDRFEGLLGRWEREFKRADATNVKVRLGCGIHTGRVFVGNVGTNYRDQFTALGSPVNVAARLEKVSDTQTR